MTKVKEQLLLQYLINNQSFFLIFKAMEYVQRYCGFTVRGTKGMYEEVTDSVFNDSAVDRSYDFTKQTKRF